MRATNVEVLVSEVGPRDGLQNARGVMSTAHKLQWIRAAAACGIREVEVCSFVPPTLVKGMADAAEVVREARTIDGLTVAALAPNLRGAENAMAAGVHKVTLPVSVSEKHSLANVRKTRAQMIEESRCVCALRDAQAPDNRPLIEGGLSTAFGCSIEGKISEDDVVRMAEALVDAGCDEVALADTAGYANPVQIKRVIARVRDAIGARLSGVHLHNTLGLGLANAMAAYEAGIRTFDASQAGLGGCPFAPGASGNIVTEDLVFMFESAGISTGIDLEGLLAIRKILRDALPEDELYGYVPDAGLPLGFTQAATTTRSLP